MEDNRGSYEVYMHGSTLSTLDVLITLWKMICVSNLLLYFHLCPKTLVFKFSAMLLSIHFSNLHEFKKYSLEHAQHLECGCILFS